MTDSLLGKTWTTSARRLISRLSRSMGLLDQILVQCSRGKAAKAVRSGSASISIWAILKGTGVFNGLCKP